MEYIKLENVTAEHGLKNANLTINKGEFAVILGHSGAGKSTLLNVIVGFVRHSGNLFLDGKQINNLPTQKRELGYLQQDIHLFPNLSVFENIAFGLKASKMEPKKIEILTKQTADMLKIAHLLDRYPKNLSGGEKQRVGLARAIIKKPKALLLDEPLSSLDEETAGAIREEIKALHKELGITMVYVTHNKAEVGLLAQKVVFMEEGKIKEIKRVA